MDPPLASRIYFPPPRNVEGTLDIISETQARQNEGDARRTRDGTGRTGLGRSGYMHVPVTDVVDQ